MIFAPGALFYSPRSRRLNCREDKTRIERTPIAQPSLVYNRFNFDFFIVKCPILRFNDVSGGWFCSWEVKPRGFQDIKLNLNFWFDLRHQFFREESMYFRYKHPQSGSLRCLKPLAVTILICLFIPFSGGCTQEDPLEVEEVRVAMPIRMPMPKPPAPPDQAETVEEKDRDQLLPALLPEEQSETLGEISEEEGYYRVRKGDCLIKIAGLEEVYDDPVKWTSLFRMNMDKLDGMEITGDFHNMELPEGLGLKFVTESEAEENLAKLGRQVYAVNVLSAETPKKIVPLAITLMKNGYNAYICIAVVKDKEWLRLRAGFFKGYSEAVEAGEHIKTILDDANVWIARVNNSELKQFGGY
jgi:hypothetical protein